MVGTDIDYVVVERRTRLVLAEARLPAYARELGDDPEVSWRGKGADLLGLTYTPPFSYYEGRERAFRVVAARRVRDHDRRHRAGAQRRRVR